VSDTAQDPTDDPFPPTLVLNLDKPITFQGGTYNSIELQEPTAGHRRTAAEQLRNGNNAATATLWEIHFVALVSGKPVAVIEQIPLSVLNRAMEYIEHFLVLGRLTGLR
jgi:hypothetical protein